MTRPLILVTNDDGVTAPGLSALVASLEAVGEVWVYAPDRNQSGVGHGISLGRPLRVHELRERWYGVDGTPCDCVLLAVRDLLDRKPDLVFSGINNGANMGDDVTYSGTVAGAYEGMLQGIPSAAISNVKSTPEHFDTAAQFAATIAKHLLKNGLPEETMLNVNVPDIPMLEVEGVGVTRMGRRNYNDEIIKRQDPRGKAYYWIGGDGSGHRAESGTDFEAIGTRRISITPLHRDRTNFQALDDLRKRDITL